MPLRWLVRPNAYHDSVKLMRVSDALGQLPGVQRAAAVMATPLNVALLEEDGLLPDVTTSANDLLITVAGEDEAAAESALAHVDELLMPRSSAIQEEAAPARLLEQVPANLAVIAMPGEHAAIEAYVALHAGMHAFLFSDNVAIEDEVTLKQVAAERDLLMMGPDCGTAILHGVGLGFANRVQRGPVGIVGASGTGIQQVCCLLDHSGFGIAQAIGTGGRDLSAAVGGSMTRRALHVLEEDPEVDTVVLISKPADGNVARQLHEELAALSKPVIACLLGEAPPNTGSVRYASTLEEAAALAGARLPEEDPSLDDRSPPGERPVYGLFAGGTLCSEAARILDGMGVLHHLVDLGEDQYTQGRAHPIIDPRLRISMLEEIVHREDVGAVLLDVILGDLAHPDPAGALVDSLQRLQMLDIPVLVTLVGSRQDPQGIEGQRATLEHAGATVLLSNARAARIAGSLARP